MKLPTLQGLIDRRLLINYRTDPQVIAPLLPKPFEPQVVKGHAIVGVCLIRLKEVRPKFLPKWVSIQSENAAHRVAVQWQEGSERKTGVYIWNRSTSSSLNAFAGGFLFPGEHHKAKFEVKETGSNIELSLSERSKTIDLVLSGQRSPNWPTESVFPSCEDASKFFEKDSLGYSPKQGCESYDGLILETSHWKAEPFHVEELSSLFFNDRDRFPANSLTFDHALYMQNLPHRWRSAESISL